jgi:hypothetical protein
MHSSSLHYAHGSNSRQLAILRSLYSVAVLCQVAIHWYKPTVEATQIQSTKWDINAENL